MPRTNAPRCLTAALAAAAALTVWLAPPATPAAAAPAQSGIRFALSPGIYRV